MSQQIVVAPRSHPYRVPPPPTEPDLVDWQLLRDWSGFVLRSPLRHRRLAAGVTGGSLLLALLYLWGMPRLYESEVRILSQRNVILPALGNPGRSSSGDSDPSRDAATVIRSRDSLLAVVKRTSLLEHFERTRAPLPRAKDAVNRLVFGTPSAEDRLEGLLGLLERRISVTAEGGVIRIAVLWSEPEMARRIVDEAHRIFLDARRDNEAAAINEAIAILERHAAKERENVARSLDDLRRARRGSARAAPPPAPIRPDARAAASGVDLDRLRLRQEDLRRSVLEMEETRSRRASELQAQLSEQLAVYAPAHPLVRQTQKALDLIAQEPPELASLRRQEAEAAASVRQLDLASRELVVELPPAPAGVESPEADYASARLRMGLEKYDTLRGRIDSARIELDTARAAFKYRYSIVRPALLPKKPSSPKTGAILLAALVGGLLLAVAACTWVDVASGRVIEPWQIERGLRIAVFTTPPGRGGT